VRYVGLVLAVVATWSVAACTAVETQSGPAPPPPRHYVVVVDRSSSITPPELENQRRVASQIIGELSFGDRFALLIAHETGPRTGTEQLTRRMPRARNPANPLEEERNALAAARDSLRRASLAALGGDRKGMTDLLSSFRSAGDHYSQSEPYRRQLIVLSDMLHCVRNGLCFERDDFGGVPAQWLNEQSANGTLPRLQDVCVAVVGGQQATPRDARVRDFWIAYFKAAGADLRSDRYRYEASGAPWRDCFPLGDRSG
jgi:hypothetical protein